MSTDIQAETFKDHSEAERVVMEALASVCPRLGSKPRMDTMLQSGLGLDQLDLVELQLSLEDRCNVVLPNVDYDACHSLSAIARLLEAVMSSQTADKGC